MFNNQKINDRYSTTICRSDHCYKFQTQQTIAQSSAEAELYAIGTTVNDVIYVRNFLHDINFTTDDKLIPQIFTDSSSAKCLTQQLGLALPKEQNTLT
eukprot:5191276-Amphidinium_carterae.3